MSKLRSFLRKKWRQEKRDILIYTLSFVGVILGIVLLTIGRQQSLGAFTCLGMIVLAGGLAGLARRLLTV